MNWKVTRPNTPISFEEGEPICMLVPQRRRELDAFTPAVIELQDAAKIGEHRRERGDSRREFNAQLKSGPVEEHRQKHHFRGEIPSGLRVKERQASLHLRAFAEDSADAGQGAAARGRGAGRGAPPRAGSR